MGDGVFVSTAVPLWFDGRFFGEVGPLDRPEIIDVRDSRMEDTGITPPPNDIPPRCRINFDGLDANGFNPEYWRKMQVVVGYYDSSGNKHRSSPSSTVYVDNVSDFENDPDERDSESFPSNWRGKEVTIYFTLPLSFLPDDLEYFVEAYVSDGPDDDPVLVDTSTINVSTTPTVDAVSIKVQLVRWVSRQPADTIFQLPRRTASGVYTSGGVLAADPWPAFSHSVVASTRFWVIDATNKGRVIYSKLFEDFIAPEHNSTLAINLGDERDLTAIGKLDDKVIVFEPDDIHVIYGEGPDNRGQGQDFAVHYISTDVGCSDQESVVETPMGLLFYSAPRGFYLLDRNLQIQFIGKGVEDVALGINVIAATLDPRKAEVRFLVEPDPDAVQVDPAGPDPDTTAVARPPRPSFGNTLPADACLSFNYEEGTWLVYNNYAGRASTVYQRQYTRLLSDWSIWQESETRFDDPTGTNRTLLRSPWIRLSEQVQNYARLWRVTFLGRYLSSLQDLGGNVYEAGDVIVRAWFDNEAGVPAQEKRYRMQDFGFDPFNLDPLRAERFQFNWTPQRGRCQSVKFEIEEVNSEDQGGEGLTYGLGRGFEIVSADFKVGVTGDVQRYLPDAVSK
jgi:hypothetical protein